MGSSSRKCYPLTVVHIFFYSGLGCLLPFLNLHVRDLGLTTWESSLVNVCAAVSSGLGSLAIYSLGRACGRLKLLSVLCLVLCALAYTSLILIPRVLRIPRHPLMEFDCSAAIRLEKCGNWATCADATLSASHNLTSFLLSDCQYVCRPDSSGASYPLHVCFRSEAGNFCEVYDAAAAHIRNASVDFQSRFPAWYFDDLHQIPAADFLGYDVESSPDFVDVCSYKPVSPLVVAGKNYDDVYCRPMPEGCQIKCHVSIDGDPGGPSQCMEVVGNYALTFWAYLGVRSAADTFLLSSAVLLDTIFVLAINDLGGAYGRSRLWPVLCLIPWPPVAGLLIDLYSAYSGRPDYSPPVFLFDGLILVTCAVLVALRLDGAGTGGNYAVSPSKRRRGHRPFWSLDLGVLFFLTLVLGTLWGSLDVSLGPRFADIGCTRLLVGASAALPFVCVLPFLAVAKNLIRNIGRANLLVFALLFYAIRLAGLSFVSWPLWILPFQAMETFTLLVAWIALVAHAHTLVSRGSRTAVHFILYFLHFGAGRALGASVDAFLEHLVGLPWTYRGLSIFSLVLGLLYLLLHHTCIKKKRQPRNSSYRSSSNGGAALFPLADRRPNGDAVHGKDNQQASRPIITDEDRNEE